MNHKIVIFFFVFFVLNSNFTVAQEKVGLVLSGGGATGYAHIGLLKALEEAEIPIDYIAGTSIGAFIGALYAVGYSPEEIEAYLMSDSFKSINYIETPKEERFLLREKDKDPSILNFNLSLDSLFEKSLPTNFITPSYLDYLSLQLLGLPGASIGNDFDSLFIPFRCVAADIYQKKNITFDQGDLNAVVRASMTYPFYINPIRIDGNLLFDGGLYNNFPADILYQEFPVDYIIGSNVASHTPPPDEDDIFSQISTMFTQKTNYVIPCDYGIIIESNSQIGTFDFPKGGDAIQRGYAATNQYIDSIRAHVDRRVSPKELRERRKKFREKINPMLIQEIEVQSYDNKDVSYVKKNFVKDSIITLLTDKEIKNYYFRAYASPQVKYIFPTLKLNNDSTYQLNLNVTKQKPLALSVGGHFSSRSINTGYIGLSYLDMGKGAVALHAETYFGKFYASTKIKADYDLPSLFPLRISPYFVLNRWDYYNSLSTFFENVNPSFVLQNELYYGLSLATAISNNSRVVLDFKKFENKDQYYQTLDYAESDTADVTSFRGESVVLGFEYNTLNRRQWASEGFLFETKVRYVQGKEKSTSGNIPDTDYDLRRWHHWVNFSIETEKYFRVSPFFTVGLHGNSVLNSQSLFSNYTATMLNMSSFSPLPDSRTIFMEEYRAPQYVGGGINLIFRYKRFLEFRIDPYYFQPIKKLVRKENNSVIYSDVFERGLPMIGTSLIFHSPIGPLRISTNWFPNQKKAFITQLSFGYVLFNDRAVR